jgi:DNA-binding beta-propeller fold protein YncE
MKFAALVALVTLTTPALAAPDYAVTKTIALGAPDNWDYVVYDPSLDRVYIGHSVETAIVDGSSGAIVGHFTGLNGAHGTAIAPAVGRGFADSGKDPSVTAFDVNSSRWAKSPRRKTPTAWPSIPPAAMSSR